MTTTMPATRSRNGTRIALVLLEVLIGLSAVWGGVMLMSNGWDLTDNWLDKTFFDSWFLPGVALLVIIGGSQLAAAAALLARRSCAREVSIVAGLIMVGWIVVQLAWLQVFHPVMQPTLFIAGCVIAALAWRLPRAARPGGPVA
jgi:hypothetical protein